MECPDLTSEAPPARYPRFHFPSFESKLRANTICAALVCYNAAMNAKNIWERYAGGQTPGEFMCQAHTRNPERAIERFISRLPGIYGIVRQASWRETFDEPRQFARDEVRASLLVHLEETREEWEAALCEKLERDRVEREQAERDRAAAEAKRREEEAARELEAPAEDTAPPQAPPTTPGDGLSDPVDQSEPSDSAAPQAPPMAPGDGLSDPVDQSDQSEPSEPSEPSDSAAPSGTLEADSPPKTG